MFTLRVQTYGVRAPCIVFMITSQKMFARVPVVPLVSPYWSVWQNRCVQGYLYVNRKTMFDVSCQVTVLRLQNH